MGIGQPTDVCSACGIVSTLESSTGSSKQTLHLRIPHSLIRNTLSRRRNSTHSDSYSFVDVGRLRLTLGLLSLLLLDLPKIYDDPAWRSKSIACVTGARFFLDFPAAVCVCVCGECTGTFGLKGWGRMRGVTSGVSKVFPRKRRLKLSRGETLYFRWTQFGIQSLRGCLFLLFGSTLVVKIKKTQESILVMPKKNNRDKENIILLPVVPPSRSILGK